MEFFNGSSTQSIWKMCRAGALVASLLIMFFASAGPLFKDDPAYAGNDGLPAIGDFNKDGVSDNKDIVDFIKGLGIKFQTFRICDQTYNKACGGLISNPDNIRAYDGLVKSIGSDKWEALGIKNPEPFPPEKLPNIYELGAAFVNLPRQYLAVFTGFSFDFAEVLPEGPAGRWEIEVNCPPDCMPGKGHKGLLILWWHTDGSLKGRVGLWYATGTNYTWEALDEISFDSSTQTLRFRRPLGGGINQVYIGRLTSSNLSGTFTHGNQSGFRWDANRRFAQGGTFAPGCHSPSDGIGTICNTIYLGTSSARGTIVHELAHQLFRTLVAGKPPYTPANAFALQASGPDSKPLFFQLRGSWPCGDLGCDPTTKRPLGWGSRYAMDDSSGKESAKPLLSCGTSGSDCEHDVVETFQLYVGYSAYYGKYVDYLQKYINSDRQALSGPARDRLRAKFDFTVNHLFRWESGLVVNENRLSLRGKAAIASAGHGTHIVIREEGSNRLWYTVRLRSSLWTPPQDLGCCATAPPALTLSPDGTLHLVVRQSDGNAYYRNRRGNGTWSDWLNLDRGMAPTSTAALASTRTGIYVVIRDEKDDIFVRQRNHAGVWTALWESVSGGRTTDNPTATVVDEILFVAARGTDNGVYLNFRTSWNGPWRAGGWELVQGGLTRHAPAVAAIKNPISNQYEILVAVVGLDVPEIFTSLGQFSAGTVTWLSVWQNHLRRAISPPALVANSRGFHLAIQYPTNTPLGDVVLHRYLPLLRTSDAAGLPGWEPWEGVDRTDEAPVLSATDQELPRVDLLTSDTVAWYYTSKF